MSKVNTKRLGDLITFKRGYDLPAKNRIKGDYPVISSSGISGYHNDYKVSGEGVVTGRYGTLGQMYYVDGKYWPHNTALYVKDFKGNDAKYIYYLLSCIGRIKTSDKSAVPGVNRNELHDMAVPASVDKSEQIAIRKILSAIDQKIELNNNINTELEAMAKLIYNYWFVQFDFPDEHGKPYKSSGGKMVYSEELKREIPEGWEAGQCIDLFEFNPKLSIKKGELGSYIDMNALSTSGFMTDKVKNKPFSGGMKFQNGDVVIARITPCLENGKTGVITLLEDNEIGFGSTEFIVLRGKYFDLKCFGICLARSGKFRKYAISKMTGTSGRKRVNYSALEAFKMALPNDALLKRFEEKVTPFIEKMTVNSKENQKLTELRDWLLPMLMNGQVTIKG